MPSVTKVIFACDESGAKGYSDQNESYDGEVGVFAGLLLDSAQLDRILPDFKTIYDHYAPVEGKFHIADLPPDRQEALRQDVYTAVTKHQLPCFWYAVHVAGFYEYHNKLRTTHDEIQQQARSVRKTPQIKRGSPRVKRTSLHVTLFSGLYANIVAFLEERARKRVEIEIRSDKIDDPIIKEFEGQMRELLNDAPLVHRDSGYNTVTKKVVHGQITVEAHLPPDMQIDIVVEKVTVNPTNVNDPLILAADVISNSLNHHFRNRSHTQKYGPLNGVPAVDGHPLTKSLDAFYDWGDGDLVGDCLFRHPKAGHFHDYS